jgi:predicted signal transduction protein with EAL and GGDEF domain
MSWPSNHRITVIKGTAHFPFYDFRCAGQVGAMYYCIGICHRGRTRGKINEGSSLLGAGSHGGDEFLYLLIEIGDEQDAAVVAKKIIQAVQVPCDVGGVELTVNTSIGIAIYPRCGKTVQTLIMSADAAMYRATQS